MDNSSIKRTLSVVYNAKNVPFQRTFDKLNYSYLKVF